MLYLFQRKLIRTDYSASSYSCHQSCTKGNSSGTRMQKVEITKTSYWQYNNALIFLMRWKQTQRKTNVEYYYNPFTSKLAMFKNKTFHAYALYKFLNFCNLIKKTGKKITELYQKSTCRLLVKPKWICGCHSYKKIGTELNQNFCDVWMNSYCKFWLLRVNCLFKNLKKPWHLPPHPLYVQGLNNQNQIFSTIWHNWWWPWDLYDELRT